MNWHLRAHENSTPIRVPGMPLNLDGELWTVLAVTEESVFLIGTYGKIREIKQCNLETIATAA